jgi:hypothetical protein
MDSSNKCAPGERGAERTAVRWDAHDPTPTNDALSGACAEGVLRLTKRVEAVMSAVHEPETVHYSRGAGTFDAYPEQRSAASFEGKGRLGSRRPSRETIVRSLPTTPAPRPPGLPARPSR